MHCSAALRSTKLVQYLSVLGSFLLAWINTEMFVKNGHLSMLIKWPVCTVNVRKQVASWCGFITIVSLHHWNVSLVSCFKMCLVTALSISIFLLPSWFFLTFVFHLNFVGTYFSGGCRSYIKNVSNACGCGFYSKCVTESQIGEFVIQNKVFGIVAEFQQVNKIYIF